MSKAVQTPVQGRYRAVQPTIPAIAVEETGREPWRPRTDGKSAVLVNPRTTVFDRRAPGLEPADPLDQVSDPIWKVQDASGRLQWTPDLVHARLLITGEVFKRMPGPLRKGYVSILGSIALAAVEPSKRLALTPEEISIADWTLVEIAKRAHRAVLLASAFGYSGDRIAETMRGKGMRTSGATVQRIYLSERRIMAGLWQSNRVPVDQLSWGRWEILFCRPKKA